MVAATKKERKIFDVYLSFESESLHSKSEDLSTELFRLNYVCTVNTHIEQDIVFVKHYATSQLCCDM
jgi:hypothetical protein